MKKTTARKLLEAMAAVALLAGLTATAQAQVNIISDNLDSHSGATGGYTFGDVTNASHTYVSGVGVGGSVGALIMSDFTAPGVGYGGVAYQYQLSNAGGLNTSPNLSDYTLSFDALVNKANGGFGITVQSWANTGFGGTFSQSSSASDYGIATANVFQHFSINLGTLGAGLITTGQTLQLAWQMDEFMYGGPGTGDQLVIDNVQLQMVPEPSSLALGALGALSGFAFLRRRKA
jgi:hypothetical protein